MKLHASCCCGQLKLTYDGEITKSSMCHCYACQKRTGSAFGSQVKLNPKAVAIEGTSAKYVRIGDAGGVISFQFCPQCGSTICWEIDKMPGFVIAAAGAFDNFKIPAPTFSVYEDRKQDWLALPNSIIEHWN